MSKTNGPTPARSDRWIVLSFLGFVAVAAIARLAFWGGDRAPRETSRRSDAGATRETLPGALDLPDAPDESPPADEAEQGEAARAKAIVVSNKGAREPNGAEALKKMIAAYQAAKGYSDRGKLTLRYKQRGEVSSESWDMAVQFFRPGRLRVDAYQAKVVSDAVGSKTFRAKILETASNNIDNQIVVRDAPAKLSLDDLGADPLLFAQLASRLQRPPVQLELLLADKPLAGLFHEDVKLSIVGKGDVDAAPCRKVEAVAPEGTFTLWIEDKTFLLRRLEFPAAVLMPEAAADPTVSELSLVAHFHEAAFLKSDTTLDLTFEVPKDAKLVKAFVPPPVFTAPHLLGKTLPPVSFVDPDGKKITHRDLRGKTTALLWFMAHPACEGALRQFKLAVDALAADEDYRLLAVCTDPSTTKSASIQKMLEGWQAPIEFARDLEAHGESVFKIDAVPALVLIDANGTVQLFVVHGDPNIGRWLPATLKRIHDGEDLAAEVHKREQEMRDEYDRLIASGGVPAETKIAKPAVEPRKASAPKRLTLTERWTIDSLESPGNIVVLPPASSSSDPDGWEIALLDEFRTLTTIDSQGTVRRRQELPLPEKASVTSLRVGRGEGGKRLIAGFAPMGPQAFVFDEDLELRFAYPPSIDDAVSPIRDVALADLKNEGADLLYVAFGDASGLHGVDARGDRRWRVRSYEPLFSIAMTPRDELLGQRLLATGRGGMMPFNFYGNNEPERSLQGWAIGQIYAGRFSGATQSPLVALALDPAERSFAVGIDATLNEQWNYPLPQGTFAHPIEPIASGAWLDGKGHWMFAGPDGSLHVVSEDGEFSDYWSTGNHLRGVALVREGTKSVLILSTDARATAYDVEVK